MWHAQGETNAPGQTARYDSTNSDASTPVKNTNQQLIGSSFGEFYADDATRKRKDEVLNWSCNIQDAPSSLQSVNRNGNPTNSFVHAPAAYDRNFSGSQFSPAQNSLVLGNQNLQLAQEKTSASNPGPDSTFFTNTNSASSQALDIKFQKGTAGNPMGQTFSSKETSSTSNAAVIEIPRLPYSQHFTYNVVGQSERNDSQSVTSATGNSGNIQGNFILRDGMNQQYSVPFIGGNVSANPPVIASKEPVQPRILTDEVLPDNADLGKKSHVEDDKKVETTAEHDRNNNILDFARSISTLLRQTNFIVSSVSSAERGDACISSKNEIRTTNDYSYRMPSDMRQHDNARTACDGVVGGSQGIAGTINAPLKTQDQDLSNNMDINKCQGIKDEICYNMLTGNINQPTIQFVPHHSHPSVSLDRESKATNGNSTSVVATKIWDGTIQLNTSSTIAAVAFFKSGEKAMEINWPQFIEIKGKVRLEAFEKFIQELPRSRSRALMVTSIRWKVGTSESGLTGIKEVGKGYKESQRVGFAHLCFGTDLYVCPRSETIITILAKYGFFKGMAVLEEDQDSLIGCVVWRRNQNVNAVPKESDSKETHLEKISDSPYESGLHAVPINTTSFDIQDREYIPATIHKADHVLAPPAQADPVIVHPAQAVPMSSESGNASYIQIVPSSMSQTKIVPSGLSIPSMGINASFVSVESEKPNQNISFIPGQPSMNNFSASSQQKFTVVPCTESAVSSATVLRKPQIDASDQQLTSSGAVWLRHRAQVTNKGANVDDDLPEFDFNTACGSSISGGHAPWTNQQVYVPAGQNAKQTPPESNQQGFVLAGQNVKHTPVDDGALAKPDLQLDVIPQQAPFHAVPAHVHPGIPLQVNVTPNHFDRIGTGHIGEKSHNPAVRENEILVKEPPNVYPKRALWDDDDMPEWCPPDLGQVHVQPQPQALPPPTPLPLFSHRPSEVDHQRQLPPPPLLPLPAAIQAATLPYPVNRQTSESLSRAPFHSNEPGHGRGLLGREPTSQIPPLRTQPVPSTANYLFERRHSPGRTFVNASRHEMKHDSHIPPLRTPVSSYANYQFEQRQSPGRNFSPRHNTIHDRRLLEPSHNEISKRQHTGLDHWEQSPGRTYIHDPRHDMYHDTRPLESSHYEASKRQHTGLDRQERSPGRTYIHDPRHDMNHDRRPLESSHYEASKRQHTCLDRQEQSPRHRLSDSSRRRPTGFDVLPRRSRRRPSLFDVKPDSYRSPGRR